MFRDEGRFFNLMTGLLRTLQDLTKELKRYNDAGGHRQGGTLQIQRPGSYATHPDDKGLPKELCVKNNKHGTECDYIREDIVRDRVKFEQQAQEVLE